jgi:hypothetical protein
VLLTHLALEQDVYLVDYLLLRGAHTHVLHRLILVVSGYTRVVYVGVVVLHSIYSAQIEALGDYAYTGDWTECA